MALFQGDLEVTWSGKSVQVLSNQDYSRGWRPAEVKCGDLNCSFFCMVSVKYNRLSYDTTASRTCSEPRLQVFEAFGF